MAALAIRIIGGAVGGAIGTFIGDKIYKYVKREAPPKQIENNSQDIKSFQDLVNIKLNEQLNNTIAEEEKEKQNEVIEINSNKDIEPDDEVEFEIESLFVNDAIYDNNYFDYYSLYFGHEHKH
jgi:membrane-associated HD superfamily phosphohydrolase